MDKITLEHLISQGLSSHEIAIEKNMTKVNQKLEKFLE